MSERKNIKRNRTRVPAVERPFYQSIQGDYKKKNKERLQAKVQNNLFT